MVGKDRIWRGRIGRGNDRIMRENERIGSGKAEDRDGK